jgi:hypothetical protein
MLVTKSVGGLSEMPTTWRQDTKVPITAATAPAHRRKMAVRISRGALRVL